MTVNTEDQKFSPGGCLPIQLEQYQTLHFMSFSCVWNYYFLTSFLGCLNTSNPFLEYEQQGGSIPTWPTWCGLPTLTQPVLWLLPPLLTALERIYTATVWSSEFFTSSLYLSHLHYSCPTVCTQDVSTKSWVITPSAQAGGPWFRYPTPTQKTRHGLRMHSAKEEQGQEACWLLLTASLAKAASSKFSQG